MFLGYNIWKMPMYLINFDIIRDFKLFKKYLIKI